MKRYARVVKIARLILYLNKELARELKESNYCKYMNLIQGAQSNVSYCIKNKFFSNSMLNRLKDIPKNDQQSNITR